MSNCDFRAELQGYSPFKTAPEGAWFDESEARKVIAYHERFCTHVKGKMAGKPFTLLPWQQWFVGNLFGWKLATGKRRFREAFLYVPRKNGKTVCAASLAHFVLFCDGEPGAEVYSRGADREQASLCFDMAKQQVLNREELAKRCKVYRKAIEIPGQPGMSIYKPLSSDAGTKHGFNTHFAVVDELHAYPNRELVDVIQTSTGAREQSMLVYITTADYARVSICNELYDYATKVRDGIVEDSSFFPLIYEASLDDDWTDEDVWRKANPNYGVSLDPEYMKRQCRKAIETPSYENTFKRLHLNIRTEQDQRWIQMDKWDESGDEALKPSDLEQQPCYAAVDLATKVDVTALCLYFPHEKAALWHYFMPEDIIERNVRMRGTFLTWKNQGYLSLTPGNVVDYDYIQDYLLKAAEKYKILEVAFDQWNASQFAIDMQQQHGFKMVEFRQGFRSMNEPSKELERMVISGQFTHYNDPVTRWMASNVAIHTDPAGNIKPDKQKSGEKIDGIVALVMALGRAITLGAGQPSVYEKRGFLTL